MSLAARITSLLTSLTPDQVGAMAPADRQLMTDQCRRVLQLADAAHAAKTAPKEGVLADLRDGRGRHNDPREDAVDAYRGLRDPPADDNELHIGMNGKPCRCTPERRAHYTRGCPDTCPCHGLPHAKCPRARPCLGDCGRLTTAHETIAGGYCVHCAADVGWKPIG